MRDKISFSFCASLFVSGVILLAPVFVRAEEQCSNIKLNTDQASEFSKIKEWMDALSAEKGSFSQTDKNGQYSTGKFSLQRPEKLRFDYSGKNGLHIIGNAGKIAYTDPSIGQVTFVPMDKTPLGLLFGKTYGWQSICLEKFVQFPKITEMTLVQKSNPDQGSLTLKFSRSPLQLLGWKIVDMQGSTTEIVLDHIKSVKHFPESHFQLPKEP